MPNGVNRQNIPNVQYKNLNGHTGWVRDIKISPDGKFIASCSNDRTIRVWNLETGDYLEQLLGHTAWVRALAFSPDGKFLASGSDDRTIKIWDTSTWSLIRELSGHQDSINSLVFYRDSKVLVSSGDDQTIRLWNIGNNNEHDFYIFPNEHDAQSIESLAFSSDWKYLVSCSYDKTVKLWHCNFSDYDCVECRCEHTFEGHESRARSVCTSHANTSFKIFSSGERGDIKFWDGKLRTQENEIILPRIYENMNINEATLTDVQRFHLISLGAIEREI